MVAGGDLGVRRLGSGPASRTATDPADHALVGEMAQVAAHGGLADAEHLGEVADLGDALGAQHLEDAVVATRGQHGPTVPAKNANYDQYRSTLANHEQDGTDCEGSLITRGSTIWGPSRGQEVRVTQAGLDAGVEGTAEPAAAPDARDSVAAASAADVDVFLSGTVFLDIVFTGMLGPPSGGREVWTDGMGSSPGGVANLAVACSRLALRTSLAAAFGGDVYGDYCWRLLSESENIDLSHSQRFEGWHTPVTVSLAFDEDRAMVTHGHPAPREMDDLLSDIPTSRLCFFDAGLPRPGWLDQAIEAGSLVFADVGWDDTEQLELRRAARATRAASTRSSPTRPRQWPTPAPSPRAPRSGNCATWSRSPS